ncbi:MAG: phosphoribosylanthranilate isomerase [Desulfococcaceae bacterium]
MIVQIYEIQTLVEAEAMLALGVDHVGTVLTDEDRWRDIDARETIRFVAESGARSSLIPLFNTPEVVFRTLDYHRPHIVHFCETLAGPREGEVDRLVALQEAVKARFPEIVIMRSVPIAETGFGDRVPSLELARRFEPVSDYFLTDTLLMAEGEAPGAEEQPVCGFVGITGRTCDWDVAAELVRTSGIPVILAGGLGPDNVAEAVRQTRPAGVDSCTLTNAVGRDRRPVRFQKDLDRVRRFVEAARSVPS